MTMTVWRGERLLGELLPIEALPGEPPSRRSERGEIAAYLIPDQGGPALEGIWQVKMPFGIGVQQFPVEPVLGSDEEARDDGRASDSACAPTRPMTEEAIRGVPIEMQITVRDEAGRVYLPVQFVLTEMRYDRGDFATVRRVLPPRALCDGSVWGVGVLLEAPGLE